MPHAIIDCSENFNKRINLNAFKSALHKAMVETGIFAIPTIRVRAFISQHYKIADGHADNAYVHISLLIKPGRSLELKDSCAKAIFTKIKTFLADDFAKNPLALSMSLEELDPVLAYQQNNLEKYVAKRSEAKSK